MKAHWCPLLLALCGMMVSPSEGQASGFADRDFHSLKFFIRLYIEDTSGRHPDSWEDIERHFEQGVLPSQEDWTRTKEKFTLLPSVQGTYSEPGSDQSVKLKMIVVSKNPVRIKTKFWTPPGRWVFWVNESNVVDGSWYREDLIKTFSAWAEVDRLVEESKLMSVNSDKPPRNSPLPEFYGNWFFWLLIAFATRGFGQSWRSIRRDMLLK